VSKLAILFVDEEPAVLEGLENRMRSHRRRWAMRFAPGPEHARRELAQNAFDVVVSDIRLSDARGLDLLERVRTEHPSALRMALTGGMIDKDELVRLGLVAHQVLVKPCGSRELEDAIERAQMLRGFVDRPAFRDLVHRVKALPVLPETYTALQACMQDPDCSLDEVSKVVSQDVSISARLLQLVNTAVFARRRPATTVSEAVSVLGLSSLGALVLSMSVFEANRPSDPQRLAFMRRLHDHAQATANLAAQLFEDEPAMAYAAATLHDIGRLVMLDLDDYPMVEAEAQAQAISLPEAECHRYGVSHAEVGAYLLGLWGLPADMVAVAAQHHALATEPLEPLVATVAMADHLAQGGERGPGECIASAAPEAPARTKTSGGGPWAEESVP